METLYFPNHSFCDPRFYKTIQKFRLLDYVILLHATVLGMTLKGLVKFISVGKTYLRKAHTCNHNKSNKYLNSILYYFQLIEIKNLSEYTLCTYPSQ